MTAGETRQLNIMRINEILRRHVPSDLKMSDTALVNATIAAFRHGREQPLIDPNE